MCDEGGGAAYLELENASEKYGAIAISAKAPEYFMKFIYKDYYTMPCAIIASATFSKPAILAPAT